MTEIRISETEITNNKGERTYNMAVFNSYTIKDQLKCLGFVFGTSYGVNCWRKDYAQPLIRDKVHETVEEANSTERERERTFATLAEA